MSTMPPQALRESPSLAPTRQTPLHFVPASVGAAISLAFWPHLASASIAPKWAALALATPLLALRSDRLDFRWLLLLVWPALGLAWSQAPLAGTGDLIHISLILLAFIVARGLQEGELESLLVGLSWGLALQVPLIVAQLGGFTGVEQLSAPPAGLFLNRDLLGEFAAPLTIWAVLSRRPVLGLVLLSEVLLSQSRIAIGLTGVALLFAPFYWRLIGATLLGIGLILLLDPHRSFSAIQRVQIWITTLHGSSLRGSGIGAFAHYWPFWEYSHSDFLQACFEFGIPATLGFVGATFRIIRWTPIGITFGVVLAEALVDFPLHLPASGFLFAICAGSLARTCSELRLRHSEGRVDHLKSLWKDLEASRGGGDSPAEPGVVSVRREASPQRLASEEAN